MKDNIERTTIACVDATLRRARIAGIDIIVRAFAAKPADGLEVELNGVTVVSRGILGGANPEKIATQVEKLFPKKATQVKR